MTSTKSQFGYFFLADITGFSSYLAGVELEDAGGILQKLLEGVTGNIEPVFRAQDFDIDSVFAYAPEMDMKHFEDLLDLIKATYFEFKNNLTVISDHITCTCAACRNVTSLDLKFMIHYGEYNWSGVQERQMLFGSNPTFVRNRGWKDIVSVSFGWRGYVLFTERCLASLHMPVDNFQGEKFDDGPFKMIGVELKTNDE